MRLWFYSLMLLVMCAPSLKMLGQDAAPAASGVRRTATIHWQRVPLRDTIDRLKDLFDETVIVDRRVDPNQRVSLDIEASSAEEVVLAIAARRKLGAARIGRVVYLGPSSAAQWLGAVAAARRQDVARLPGSMRGPLERKQSLKWPKLSEPRELVSSLIQQRGWRASEIEKIPHDLWAAGSLPELAFAEQLTVLLIGFDLTFEIQRDARAIRIVPLEQSAAIDHGQRSPNRSPLRESGRNAGNSRQVYTLRVAEQPVGVVLRELTARLNWPIDVDEAAIRKAGRTLDTRVSFAVKDAGQDELLEALLRPAGLGFHREDERIKIVPRKAAAQNGR